MILTRAALRLMLVITVVFGQAGPACGSGTTVRGAGATFPFPLYARWSIDYEHETGVKVQYVPVGSGAGVEQIARRQVDFGASDTPLSHGELQRMELVQFPVTIGAVVPVIHIAGVRSGELKLSGKLLADIYLGRIRKWNDPAIVALNDRLSLPSSNITVVHRSDSSGSTHLWSEFLSSSNLEWKTVVGAANLLSWPIGVGGVGNEGVAASVQRTRVSIGYVEYAYAVQHGLSLVSLLNRDGHRVVPGAEAFEAAASATRWSSVADLEKSLIDASGAVSWPITSATFILVPARPGNANQAREVLRFFDWALRRGKQAALDLGYVPIPGNAVRLIDEVWAERLQAPDGAALWPDAGHRH